jgi:hypothetical protein
LNCFNIFSVFYLNISKKYFKMFGIFLFQTYFKPIYRSLATLGGVGVAKAIYAGGMLSAILNNDDHNEVTDALVLSHTIDTGTAAAGVGVGVSVHVENAAGTVAERAAMDFTLTDVTDGAEIGQFELKLAKGDGTVPTVLTVNGVQATVAMDTDSRYVLFSVAVTVVQSRWCSVAVTVLQSRCCSHGVAVTVLQSRCYIHSVAPQ